MVSLPDNLSEKLNHRNDINALRSLPTYDGLVDFYSNDYLGYARSPKLRELTGEIITTYPDLINGSTGSRLIGGNNALSVDTETYLADYYNTEAALIFNSGYTANIGLLSCIANREDTIIYDEHVHASIRDGIRLSVSRSYAFKHNDVEDLSKKLEQASGNVFVVTESVFSMSGVCAPLKELASLARGKNFFLIIDEAHAVGYLGEQGRGLCDQEGVAGSIFARIITFGKAMGAHGAAIVGASGLKKYLVNFSRAFIYTTALSPHGYAAIYAAHKLREDREDEVKKLKENILYYKKLVSDISLQTISSDTPVQSVFINGNDRVKKLAAGFRAKGIGVAPILHPTVPEGEERIRICLHAFNTKDEIDQLVAYLKSE